MLDNLEIDKLIEASKDNKIKQILTVLKNKEEDELTLILKICLDLYETDDRVMNLTSYGVTIPLTDREDFMMTANLVGKVLEIV